MDNLQEKNQKNSRICQYLGGPQDLDTFYHYPSDMNRCFRPVPKRHPSQTHQTEYCLNARHVHCPVFQPDWNGEFPSEIQSNRAGTAVRVRPRSPRMTPARRAFLIGIIITLATLAFIAILGWRNPLVRLRSINLIREIRGIEPVGRLPALVDPSPTPGQSPEPTAAPTNTPRPTNTFVPTADPVLLETPLPSETPLPGPTPFPTPGPGFETPFGPEQTFLIHVVAAGESFSAIAQVYGTTADVLQAVNPIVEGASLWVGRQLVVPIGVTDVGQLPAFEVVLTIEATTLSALADQYNSDAELIRYYNQLGESELIPAGRWLILPLPESG